MPYKPKSPCSYPGCPKLTNNRYCDEHAKVAAKQYERYERDREAKNKYNGRWKKIRARYIHSHPLCERCLAEGRFVEAEQVHHKVPLSEGGTHAESNLQSLCAACHAKTHAERGDRWGKKGKREAEPPAEQTTPRGRVGSRDGQ